MNPKIMNPNDDFQLIKYRSGKTTNIDIAGSKQEQNNHSSMNEKHQSIYNILTINDNEEMDVAIGKETTNSANGDASIGEKKAKPQSKKVSKIEKSKKGRKTFQANSHHIEEEN